MNGIRTLFVLAMLVWMGAAASAQQTIYVRANGNDANNGATAATANLTIAGALADAVAGNGDVTIDIGAGAFAGATVGYNVTLRGANAGAALANWGDATTITSTIVMGAAPGIELYIEGVAFGAITPVGGANADGRVTISNCTFTESNPIATATLGWNELSIVGCSFDGNADNLGANVGSAITGNGLQVLYVTETLFSDYLNAAIDVSGAQNTVKITSNTFTNCNTSGTSTVGAVTLNVASLTGSTRINKNLFTSCSNGVVTSGALAGKDVTVQYNRFASTPSTFFAIKNAGTGLLSASCNNYGTDAGPYVYGGGGATDIYVIVGNLLSGSIEAGPFNQIGTDTGGDLPGFEPDADQQCGVAGPITSTSTSKSYFRIQDGIDASGNGATVTVAGNSSFTGNITIGKDLTLRGADTSALTGKSLWSTVNGTVTITLAAETVKLVGLKITSPTATTLVSNSAGTLTQINRCLVVVDPTAVVPTLPLNGAIHHVRSGALFCWGTNVLRPVSVGAESQQYIRAVTLAAANSSRLVHLEECRFEGTLQFTAMSVYSTVIVKNNNIVDAGVDGISVTGNVVRTFTVTGNSIVDSRENGIGIRGPATVGSTSASISGNKITGSGKSGSTYAAINIAGTSYGTQTYNDNYLADQTGSNKSFINGRSGYSPVATCNWWGVTSEDDLINKISGSVTYDNGTSGWRGAGGNSANPGYAASGAGSACTIRSFSIALAGTDITCFGGTNGLINTTLSGTTEGPSYSWTKAGSVYTASTKDISSLTAGTYTVSVNNGTGNVRTKSTTISEPTQLSGTSSKTNIACNGANDGRIDVTSATGGVTPSVPNPTYNYRLDKVGTDIGDRASQTNTAFTGLTPGNYDVYVIARGVTPTCEVKIGTQTIAEPTAITASASVTSNYGGSQISCNGLADGAITVTASGGTGSLQYSKDNGASWQTSNVFSGLGAGTYSFKVKDVNTCSTTVSNITITQPTPVTASASVTSNYGGSQISCNGLADGAITVTASGGTGSLQYSKDNGANWQTSNVFSGLGAGTYSFKVKDVNTCSTTVSNITITQPTPVTASASVTSNYGGSQISCNGLADGAITVTASGGTGSLQYSKDNGANWQTSNVFSGLGAGTYSFKVKDVNTCSTTVSNITITQPTPVTASASVTSNYGGSQISCNGLADGVITVTASGGTGSLQYSKDNGASWQTSNVFSGLGAGTYSFKVKDVNTCSTTVSNITITQPTPVTASASVTSNYGGSQISCNGLADGAITVTASGGTGSLQYSKDNGANWQTSNVFSGLGAGTYSFKVKDVNTCSTTVSNITITQPTPVTASASVTSNYGGSQISCNGLADGAITVTASGGTGSLQYSKDNGANWQTSNVFSGLGAGTYSFKVKDVNTCSTTVSNITITQPTPVTASASVTSNYGGSQISCNGLADGAITVTASGGTGSLQYSKDNGANWQTSNVFSGLGAGTYSFKVKDVNTCSTTVSNITITQPTPVTASASVTSNYGGSQISCNGLADGVITVTASGGTGSLQYSKDNGASWQTSNVFSGLGAGTYSFKVKDVNTCSTTVSNITITQPTPVTASASVTSNYGGSQISCNGLADGAITVTASGGTGSLQYSKDNGANWQTSNVFSGLGAGTYSFKVKDVNTCSTTVSNITITQPTPVTASASVTSNYGGSQISCNGLADGVITVTASGGTGSLQYSKDNGANWQTSNVFSGLGAGTYSFKVKDVNTCSTTVSNITITQPTPVTASASVTSNYGGSQISCNGLADGAITVTASGGTGSLQYSKDNGANWQTSNVFSGLGAGTYSFKVKDVNTCSTTVSNITITQPTPVTASASVTSNYGGSQISCNGLADGAITVTASGGTGSLQYSKDNGANWQTSNVFSGLGAGTYSFKVKDVNTCSTTVSNITITQPTPVTASASVTSNYGGSQISCNGLADGVITVTASGGTGSLQYSKDNGASWQTSNVFSGLGAGTYSFKVKDVNTCSTTVSNITITQPTPVTASASVTSNYGGSQISCNGLADGAITVTASGGTGSLQYSKDNGANWQTSNVFSGLGAGTYSFKVKDVNTCSTTVSNITITQPTPVTASASVTSNYGGSQISCNGLADGVITVTASGGTGSLQYSKDNGANWQTSNVFSGLGAGTYSFKVKDVNTCSTTVSNITITQPTPVTASASVTSNYGGSQISCNGLADGAITVTASGGTGSLQYSKDNGANWQTSNVFSGLGAGTYSFKVKDVNTCSTTVSNITITQPTPVTASASVTSNYGGSQISCNGLADGVITVTASGGTGSLQYSKDNGANWQTSNVFSGLGAGTYSFKVKDVNTCSTTVSNITITQPSALAAAATATSLYPGGTRISCNGASDGEITISTTGGTGVKQYSKDNGLTWQGSNVFTGLAAGSYTFQIKDVNNCATTASASLSEPTVQTASLFVPSPYNGFQLSCPTSSDGSIELTHSGGTAPYTYVWEKKNGANWIQFATTQSVQNRDAGEYRVTIKDVNLCSLVKTTTITGPGQTAVLSHTQVNMSCHNVSDGTVTLTVTGGTGTYTYSKDGINYQTSNTFTGLSAGNFKFYAKDENNCVSPAYPADGFVTITAPLQITVSSLTTNGPVNAGTSIEFTTVISGGTQNTSGDKYSYSWAKPRTEAQAPSKGLETLGDGTVTQKFSIAVTTASDNGEYTLTVTDKNSCSKTASVTIRVWPATLYVSTAGSDATGDGREVNPLRTIQKAIDVALATNTISVQTSSSGDVFNESPVITKALNINGVNAARLGTGKYFVYGTSAAPINWGTDWHSDVFKNVGINSDGTSYLQAAFNKVTAASDATLWFIGNHSLTTTLTVNKQITLRGATSSAGIASYTGCDIEPPATITYTGSGVDSTLFVFSGTATKGLKDLTLKIPFAGQFAAIPNGSSGNVDPVENVRFEWDHDNNSGTAHRRVFGVTNGSFSGGEKFDVAKFVYDAEDNGYGTGRFTFAKNGPLPWNSLVIGWKAEDGGTNTNLASIRTLEPMKSNVKLQSTVSPGRRPILYTNEPYYNNKWYLLFDGAMQYLDAFTTEAINAGSQKSLFVVFRPLVGSADQVIYKHGDEDQGMSLVHLSDGRISLNIYEGTNSDGRESWVYEADASHASTDFDDQVLIAQMYFNGNGDNNTSRRVGASLDNSAGRITYDVNHTGEDKTNGYVPSTSFTPTALTTPATIGTLNPISLGARTGAMYYASWNTGVTPAASADNSFTTTGRSLFYKGSVAEVIMLDDASIATRDAVYCYLRNKYYSGSQTVENGLNKGVVAGDNAKTYEALDAWPNPAEDELTVEALIPQSGNVVMMLRDALGRPVQLLHEGFVIGGTMIPVSANVRDVQSGAYFIHVQGAGDLNMSLPIIIRH